MVAFPMRSRHRALRKQWEDKGSTNGVMSMSAHRKRQSFVFAREGEKKREKKKERKKREQKEGDTRLTTRYTPILCTLCAVPPANLPGASALQLQADPKLYCKVYATRVSICPIRMSAGLSRSNPYYEYTRVMRNLGAASMCMLAVVAAGASGGETGAICDKFQKGIIGSETVTTCKYLQRVCNFAPHH